MMSFISFFDVISVVGSEPEVPDPKIFCEISLMVRDIYHQGIHLTVLFWIV